MSPNFFQETAQWRARLCHRPARADLL